MLETDIGIIYSYQNILNEKYYVGCTTERNFKIRQSKHQSANSGCKKFNNAMKKHGMDSFVFRILEDDIRTEEQLHDAECYWIAELNAYKNGYNQTSGGEVGKEFEHTKESKSKIKENNSKYWKGRKKSEEHCRKISEGLKHTIQTESQIKKRSDSMKKAYIDGRKKKCMAKPIMRLDTKEYFNSGAELARAIGGSGGGIRSAIYNRGNPIYYKSVPVYELKENETVDTIDIPAIIKLLATKEYHAENCNGVVSKSVKQVEHL